MNKAIITVVGQDTVGIIARVCTYLSQHNVNVLDISQTIIDGYLRTSATTSACASAASVRKSSPRCTVFEAARSAGRLTRGGGKPGGLSTDGAILIPLMRVTAKLVFKYPVRNKPC